MEMTVLRAQYNALNTAHLTVDELEHELMIRKMDKIAPRASLKRALRNRLKEEDGQSNISYDFSKIDIVEELETCDDKLNSIKAFLENRRSKKAPDQCFKNRLIHILFRMERLRNRELNDESLNGLAVVAGECLRLLSTFFSAASHLPEVRAAELAIVNESLSRLREGLGQTNEEREEDRAENVNVEEEEVDRVQVPQVAEKEIPVVESHSEEVEEVGAPEEVEKLKVEQAKLTAENKQLLEVVGQLLQRIEILEAERPKQNVPVPEQPAKTLNSTQLGETERIQPKSSQQEPTDFLKWLKDRNSSISSSEHAVEPRKVVVVPSQPKSSERERSRSNSNRLPVHKWTIRYDGMDNGKRLNEFVKEVEFNARSEGFSDDELFQSAHHLFTHKARAWFMEVNGNYELGSWKELVHELKNEFLPIDIDYVYERQAYNRKQGAKEKFQDYYLDMVRIFRGMSSSWDDRRKFDVLFRNTREDVRIAMLAAGVNDVPKMKEFGKKFDAINWQLYQRNDRFPNRPIRVDELNNHRQNFPNRQDRYRRDEQDRRKEAGRFEQKFSKGNGQKSFWKQRDSGQEHQKREQYKKVEKPDSKPQNPQRQKSPVPGPSGSNALQRIVKAYIPIKKGICFNCHENDHGFEECPKEKHTFCFKCGFPGFTLKNCPYCQTKNMQETAQ
ncbi:uncharacterized protein LOC134284289 [Aedes albopictus]|uniref:CCHC-type domain-containing protein n=1 Tax=Aedes albopictus TaxID=7160 RepID=A0ABM1ZHG5_AEDAL